MEEAVNPIKRKYKYAADYGLILGGYIASFFILDYLIPNSFIVNTLSFVGFLCTPVICFYLAKQYRDKAWGGFIRFGQVWSFGIWLFVFASLLMSVLYYVRYQFLQPNYISDSFNQVLILLEQSKYPKEQIDQVVASGIPTAIELVLVYLWLYIIGGAILFLIISPMIVRKKPEDTLTVSNQEKPYEPYQDKNDSNESQS